MRDTTSDLRGYYELMATVGGCYNLTELFARVGPSMNMAAWMTFLQVRAEEEEARIKAMTQQ
jgi:hypothetical protein